MGGGKGGVGTSTLAALAAVGLAREGVRVLLVETGSGDLPILFGLGGERAGIGDLSRPGVKPADLLIHPLTDLDVLPAGRGEGSIPDPVGWDLLLRRVSDLYEDYSIVIVDGGNRAASILAACGGGVGRAFIVARPDRMASAGCYALLKVLGSRLPRLEVDLVVNTVAPGTVGGDPGALIREAARTFLGMELRAPVCVPVDPSLPEALAAGASLAESEEGIAAASLLAGVLPRLPTRPGRGNRP